MVLFVLYVLALVTSVSTTLVLDPCKNYTVLDEPWRATNYTVNLWHCDRRVAWHGWYRLMYYGHSVQLPERCLPSSGCGTAGKLWMNGTHPRIQDGIVMREMCKAVTRVDCCYGRASPIQVKACPGNYFVYRFVAPKGCNFAYCADVDTISTASTFATGPSQLRQHPQHLFTPSTPAAVPSITGPSQLQQFPQQFYFPSTPATVPSTTVTADPCLELSCTEAEVCGEAHDIYGCLCNKSDGQPNQQTFGLVVTCHSSSGWISLSRCLLSEAGFPAAVLHLNDPNCTGTVHNGRVHFQFNNDDQKCGTRLKANKTHFIYENAIQGKVDSAEGHLISRQRQLNLQFVCEYPLTHVFSMDMAVHAVQSSIKPKTETGQGTYHVQLTTYQDANFTEPFSGNMSVQSDERIYIVVRVPDMDARQFSNVLDSCWATPLNDPTSSIRWDLIINQCPNPEDETVEVLRNGLSTSSRFSFRMFIFNGFSSQVYLHCSLHLCPLRRKSCIRNCNLSHRQIVRKSTDMRDIATSYGPLSFSENADVLDVQAPESARRHRTSFLF